MKNIPLQDTSEIDYNAFPLYYENGAKMLTAGVQLNDDIISLLERQNIESLLVYDDDTKDISVERLLEVDFRNELRDILRQMFLAIQYRANQNLDLEFYTNQERETSNVLRKALREFKGELGMRFVQGDMADQIAELIQGLPTYRKFLKCPVFPRRSEFWYADHCIDVTILSLLLARRCGFLSSDQRKIGLGALLHDIGYAFFSEKDIEPFDELNPDQEPGLENHTVLGYAFLRLQQGGDLVSAQIPYGHHEKQDGSGYPRGIEGTNRVITNKQEALKVEGTKIHRYADLVAVTNTYDRMIRGMPEGETILHDECIEYIKNEAGQTLNKEVVEAFLEIVPKYPVATPVRAIDGEYEGYRGIVANVPPGDLHQPIVRFLYSPDGRLDEPKELDLRTAEGSIECISRLT